MEKKYLTTVEAAKFLCISLSKLWKMCHKKQLSYYKMGRLNLFLVDDLNKYLDQNKVLSTKELEMEAEKRLLTKKTNK